MTTDPTADQGHAANEDAGVRLVRQEHAWGCGVAALAMVTGQTYDEVRTWILDNWTHNVMGYDAPADWLAEHGVTSTALDWYLAEHGYAWRRVYRAWAADGAWPPAPFAPVHVAQVVQPSGGAHFVVLTEDGRVLDPMSDASRSLTDWETVNHVQGVWSIDATEARVAAARAEALQPVRALLTCGPNTFRHYYAVDGQCQRCGLPSRVETVLRAVVSREPGEGDKS